MNANHPDSGPMPEQGGASGAAQGLGAPFGPPAPERPVTGGPGAAAASGPTPPAPPAPEPPAPEPPAAEPPADGSPASGHVPETKGAERWPVRTNPIVWGALILAFCGYVVQRTVAPDTVSAAGWITATVLGLGLLLLLVGIAVAIRSARR